MSRFRLGEKEIPERLRNRNSLMKVFRSECSTSRELASLASSFKSLIDLFDFSSYLTHFTLICLIPERFPWCLHSLHLLHASQNHIDSCLVSLHTFSHLSLCCRPHSKGRVANHVSGVNHRLMKWPTTTTSTDYHRFSGENVFVFVPMTGRLLLQTTNTAPSMEDHYIFLK